MKNFIVRNMPEDFHHAIKIQAAIENISMNELILKALGEYLKKVKKRKEGRHGKV